MLSHKEEMKQIWKSYVLGKNINTAKIRSVILESWQRCKGKVDPFIQKGKVLSSQEIETKIKSNSQLIEVAKPVIQRLYEYVAGSGFTIMLCDKAGICLDIIGDKDILKRLSEVQFIKGSNFSEEIIGTNSIGTSIIINKPLQVFSFEHWSVICHIGTCSAAPIHDPDTGKIIGVINMTGTFEKVHSHTLGMVVAAADSIEKQLQVLKNWYRIMLADQYKALIMESMSDGVIAIDNTNKLTHINRRALEILNIKEVTLEKLIDKNINTIIERYCSHITNFNDLTLIMEDNKNINNFLSLSTKSGTNIKCLITKRCLKQNNNVIGKVLLLEEISRVNKLINRVIGERVRVTFSDLIGRNKKFLECIEVAIRASKNNSNILLLGESGTGKDLLAQAIHNASLRKAAPFIVLNCAAIPRELLSSELFGYVEGAFTGAKKGGNLGKFALADGGTIFLDEIGDMPLEMQTSLLRVIEEKVVSPIGSGKTFPVDVRIIAATNKNLSKEVELKNFRPDLYYRLNVISIKLPPLRERKDDIPLLIEYLLKKLAIDMEKKKQMTVDPEFVRACILYDWPGNIRELCNVVERAVSLTDSSEISVSHLPPLITSLYNREKNNHYTSISDKDIKLVTNEVEKQIITSCLEKCGGNRTLAAKELGISRSTLYRKLYRENRLITSHSS